MLTQPPILSVVIPTYNSALYLPTAIASIAALAGNEEVEIIVVNDGSQDETADVARSFSERITYIELSNGGVSRARNHGLLTATGGWIAFLDADDFWLPTYWQTVKPRLAASALFDVLTFGWRYATEDGTIVGRAVTFERGPVALENIVLFNRILSNAAIVRRSLFIEAGGYETSFAYAEDWDVWMRLALRGARFEHVDTPLVVYREKSSGLSKDLSTARAHGLSVIQRAFSDPRMPHSLSSAHRKVQARFLLQLASEYLGTGRPDEAADCVQEAARLAPSLLAAEQSFFAFASSSQPLHARGAGEGIDLARQADKVRKLMARANLTSLLTVHELRATDAAFHRSFLKLAYLQGDRGAMIRHWHALAQTNPCEWKSMSHWSWIARILAGRPPKRS